MTLLTIVNSVSDRTSGFNRPGTVIANPDSDAQKLLSLTLEVGEELKRAYAWQALRKERTFTSVATEEQTSILPSDFDRFVPETFWDRTDQRLITGSISATEWQGLKAGDSASRLKFIQRGDAVSVFPTLAAGKTLAFEYVSTQWVDTDSDGVGDAVTWAADTDTPVFDEELMIQGTIFAFLEGENLPSATAFAKFDRTLKRLIRNDQPTMGILPAADIFRGRHFTGEPKTGSDLW